MAGFGLPSFDYSFLSGYYAAQSRTQLAQSLAAQRTRTLIQNTEGEPKGVYAPWDTNNPKYDAKTSSQLRAALETSKFVNVEDAAFNKPGVASDHRQLFALYKGLVALKTLADRAGDEKVFDGERLGLANRFASGMAEVKSFVGKTVFDDLTLLYANKAPVVTSKLAIARSRQEYQGNAISNGASDTALLSVTGTEIITINVKKAGATTPVSVDLSELVGTVSLDAVIILANEKLAAAGMVSRLKRQTFEGKDDKAPKQYGITIQGAATEKLTFSAAAAQPALYVGGVSGAGDVRQGSVTKLSGLGASAPETEFTEAIDPATGTADVRAMATDAEGNVYSVGTATGDLGPGVVQGEQDAYLRKYDSAGQLLWSRMLGSTGKADGYALAVDSSGNAVITGRVSDKLTSLAAGGNGDTFVTKYDAQGLEVFTRQIGSSADDQANAVAIGADGSIYIGGQAKGTMAAGATYAGGTDAFIQKLTSTGTLVYTRQFGGATDDRITGLAVDANGDLVAASVSNGVASAAKYSTADEVSSAIWQVDLGSVDDGGVTGLALKDGAIYVSGTTSNAALTAGGAASVVQAHAGGTDAFVFKLTDNGASATSNFVTYIGSAGTNSGGGVAIGSDGIYLSGTTRDALPGQSAVAESKSNAFVAKFDLNGAQVWAHQYAGAGGAGSASAVVIDEQGSSVLDALGLPRSEITYEASRLVTAQSSVRAGDYFTLQVNDFPPRKIIVKAGDTLRTLALRINSALALKGTAEVARGAKGDGIKIKTNDDTTISIKAGDGAFDALAGLGLTQGVLYGKDAKPAKQADGTNVLKEANVFSLGMADGVSLSTKDLALQAATMMDLARTIVQQAYERLVNGPAEASAPAIGQASAVIRNQLANYQMGLLAFGGGNLGSY